MKKNLFLQIGSSIAKGIICGGVIGIGMTKYQEDKFIEGLVTLPTDMQSVLQYIPDFGNTYIVPVMDDLIEGADDDKVFGFKKSGREAAHMALHQSWEVGVELINTGNIYGYYDDSRTAGNACYFTPVFSQHEPLLGINFSKTYPINFKNGEIIQFDEYSYHHASHAFTIGTVIHEGSHKYVKHKPMFDHKYRAVERDHYRDEVPELIKQYRDTSYFLDALSQDLEGIILAQLQISRELDREIAEYKRGERTAQELYDNMYLNFGELRPDILAKNNYNPNRANSDYYRKHYERDLSAVEALDIGLDAEKIEAILEKTRAQRYRDFYLTARDRFREFCYEHSSEIIGIPEGFIKENKANKEINHPRR